MDLIPAECIITFAFLFLVKKIKVKTFLWALGTVPNGEVCPMQAIWDSVWQVPNSLLLPNICPPQTSHPICVTSTTWHGLLSVAYATPYL